MFDGKMLRGLTGTPMRRIALAKSALAEAEPEPFTFANLMTKSLTASRCIGAAPRAPGWTMESSLPRQQLERTLPLRQRGALGCLGGAPGFGHPEARNQLEEARG